MRAEDALPSARRWMRRLQFLLLASGALLWLSACMESGAKVAGGTGSEAGDAYGEVWSIRGEKRAASARVRLYASADSFYAHPALQSETQTDSAGRFRFAIGRTGDYDLEIRSRDGAELAYRRGLRIPAGGETDLGVFHLAEAAVYQGRLPAVPASPTRIWLAGTPYAALADSAGAFSFPSLPPGDYPVFTERSQGDSLVRENFGGVQLAPGDSLSPPRDTLPKPPIVLPDTGSTTGGTAVPWNALIENFDDGDRRSTWGEDHGGGLWTTSASGVTAMIPSTSEFSSTITIQAGHWGRGLEVEYRAAPLITATATARLAMEKPLTALLQQADTLAFWARGDGQLVVELNFVWGATADAPARVRAGMATLNLAPGWRQYKVPVADAQAAGDGESRIRFTGSNGSLYRLDDIALIGTAR